MNVSQLYPGLSEQGNYSRNKVIEAKSHLLAETSRVDVFTVVLAQLCVMLGQCGRDPTGCSVKDIVKAGISESFGWK